MRTRLEREVRAPASTVWDVVTDIERSPDVISGIDRVERLDDGEGFGAGVRWRETRTLFGRQATEEMEVTSVDPGRAYTVEADSRGAHYRSTVEVDPVGDDRSQLRMSFEAEPQGAVASLMAKTIGRLFEGATRKALRQDLDDVAVAAERRSA